jgi:hypothetical protein
VRFVYFRHQQGIAAGRLPPVEGFRQAHDQYENHFGDGLHSRDQPG